MRQIFKSQNSPTHARPRHSLHIAALIKLDDWLFVPVFMVAIMAYLSPILFYWIFHPMRAKECQRRWWPYPSHSYYFPWFSSPDFHHCSRLEQHGGFLSDHIYNDGFTITVVYPWHQLLMTLGPSSMTINSKIGDEIYLSLMGERPRRVQKTTLEMGISLMNCKR